MWEHVFAILGLGLACGGWIALQMWIVRRDPQARIADGRCASCTCGHGECTNGERAAKPQ